jgi:hypothetical protein
MSRPIIGRSLTTRALISRAILARGVGSGVVPPAFCPLRNYIEISAQDSTCVITDNNVVVTSLVNVGGFSCFVGGDTVINLDSANVWSEVQVTQADCDGCGGGALVAVGTGKDTEFFGVLAFGFGTPGAGFIVDLDFNTLASGLTLPLGWAVQLRVDGTTGDISWEDTENNGGFLINVPDIVTFQLINFAAIGGGQVPLSIGDTVSFNINENYSAPLVTVPAGYVGYCNITPPPPVDCRIISLSTQFIGDGTALVSNNETTMTSLALTPDTAAAGFFDDTLMEVKINNDKFAFEMIAQEPTGVLGENGFSVLFGQSDVFTPFEIYAGFGLSIPPLGTGIGDWQIAFVDNVAAPPVPLLSNLTITFPYIVKVVFNGDNLTFKDNQVPANTGVLGTKLDVNNVFGSLFMINAVNNSVAGNTQTLQVEGRRENFVIDFENDAKDWCNLQGGVDPSVPYTFIELFQSGSASFVDRIAGWVTVNGVGATWIGNPSYSFINTDPKDNFVFEFPTITADLDAATGGKQIRYITGDIFADTNYAGLITIQKTQGQSNTLVSFNTQNTLDSNYDSTNLLFEVPTELGFVAAIGVIDKTNVRVCYKTAKQTVFFQEISLQDYGLQSNVVVALLQGSNLLPSGQEYRVQYNGTDDDLVIDSYPDNFLGYDGSALPTKTDPEDLIDAAAWLLDYYILFPENVGLGEYVNITNSGKTANAITTFNQPFLLNCSRFIQRDQAFKVAVTYQIDGLVTGGTNPNAFRFELLAVNRANTKLSIELVGLDLVLKIIILGVESSHLIKANYVAAVGDQLCLVVDSLFGQVNGILNQGAVLFQSGLFLSPSASDISWMPRAGHDNANGNTMVIANQYLTLNLPNNNLKTELNSLGALDILLNPY